jgi:hypothetical protein
MCQLVLLDCPLCDPRRSAERSTALWLKLVSSSISPGASPYVHRLCLQQVIDDIKARMKDPDLARLFENTFPNTLGTQRDELMELLVTKLNFHRHDNQVL